MQLRRENIRKDFLHFMTTDRLQKAIADEYIETDMLKTFDNESLFRRITFWQVLTILLAFFFSHNSIVLSTKVNLLENYSTRCAREMQTSQIDFFGDEKEILEDLTPFLCVFLAVHIFDWLASRYERAISKSWGCKFLSFYRYTEPHQFKMLEEQDANTARITFWVVLLVRVIALSWVYSYVMKFRYCQPLLAACLYQDFGVSMFVQVWVIIEQFIEASDQDLMIRNVIENDIFEAKRHFFRLRFIFEAAGGSIKDKNLDMQPDISITDANDDPLKAHEAQREREINL